MSDSTQLIPDTVAKSLAALLGRLALAQDRKPKRLAEIVLTLRLRPIDRLGRQGCYAELRPSRTSPAMTFLQVEHARVTVHRTRYMMNSCRTNTSDVSHVVSRRLPSGGWMLTFDCRWGETGRAQEVASLTGAKKMAGAPSNAPAAPVITVPLTTDAPI